MTTLIIQTLLLAMTFVTLIWLLSFFIGRVDIIDAFWGPGFLLIAGLCHWQTRSTGWNRPETLLLAMVALWSLRLGAHLAIRVWRDPHEDRRYAAMRTRHDPGFRWKSLGIVFLLQGLIMWFVALPVTAAYAAGLPAVHIMLAAGGVLCWAVGLYFETVGDWQLVRFRACPGNRSEVLNTGLWSLTRHPNYFGDFSVWWGIWLFSIACGAPFWTVLSPAVMSLFLMKVSGVGLLEKDIAERRSGFTDYVRSTNAFFPGYKRRQ